MDALGLGVAGEGVLARGTQVREDDAQAERRDQPTAARHPDDAIQGQASQQRRHQYEDGHDAIGQMRVQASEPRQQPEQVVERRRAGHRQHEDRAPERQEVPGECRPACKPRSEAGQSDHAQTGVPVARLDQAHPLVDAPTTDALILGRVATGQARQGIELDSGEEAGRAKRHPEQNRNRSVERKPADRSEHPPHPTGSSERTACRVHQDAEQDEAGEHQQRVVGALPKPGRENLAQRQGSKRPTSDAAVPAHGTYRKLDAQQRNWQPRPDAGEGEAAGRLRGDQPALAVRDRRQHGAGHRRAPRHAPGRTLSAWRGAHGRADTPRRRR